MQVSVITVKRAYLELERDGVIVTRQGKGSFVADSAGLSAGLRHAELDQHLASAAAVGRSLGLTAAELRPGCETSWPGRTKKSDERARHRLDGVEKTYPTSG